jgi:hypothetical protein
MVPEKIAHELKRRSADSFAPRSDDRSCAGESQFQDVRSASGPGRGKLFPSRFFRFAIGMAGRGSFAVKYLTRLTAKPS